MPASRQSPGSRPLATNRKALRDYQVLERLEAGLVLTGTETKSVRAGGTNLTGAFARIAGGRVTLCGAHIAPYESGNRFNHEPGRPRTLLLHRQQIERLAGQIAQKGLTLVPLSVYFRKRWAKVELGLCRGRREADKREAVRRRLADQEARRAMARDGR
jgi:SsrA-binding protein